MYNEEMGTVRKHYEAKLSEYGEGYKAANWSSEESQLLRFKILASIGDLNGKTVLDIGCGLGDFNSFLKDNGIKCNYIGLDISEKFVEKARKLHPNATFVQGDCLADKHLLDAFRDKIDYVFMSGTLNVKLDAPEERWGEFVKGMVRLSFGLANLGVAFNIMSPFVDYKTKSLYHWDVNDMAKFCTGELTRRFVLRHDYPLWEYTVYLYKGAAKA